MNDTPAWQLWLLNRLPRPIVLIFLSLILVCGAVSALFLIGVAIVVFHIMPFPLQVVVGAGLAALIFAWTLIPMVDLNLPRREKKS
jgi:hypothetical protein